ncbi:TIGR03086 family metal-binding protein [Actinopolymorpha pittospori]|uniref:Uncharacterized protein (TIGR03086 family) n=1 Tax=Actinopolymorpha pittospori TaxID=648752 RepID=A0A927RKF5_9ACTN|nr:TIGR03086 family metal-binding protein [Actinopolymorpha pittospori]MBE1606663.1 uncharacterized protein (TIGR03086 family) [Actinopolymorpha pittospori]
MGDEFAGIRRSKDQEFDREGHAMTTMHDFGPPAQELTRLAAGVKDDQLSAPTPCAIYTVADLLDHLMGLSLAFTWAATKATEPLRAQTGDLAQAEPGLGSAANLDPEWRKLLPVRLGELVEAWRDPAAWEGTTEAGGLTLPGEVAAMVAMDELVLHGWDLARATGQPFHCDPGSTEVCFQFTTMSAAPGADREGLFGPIVEVAPDAPLLDRALGLSGRDPAWTP